MRWKSLNNLNKPPPIKHFVWFAWYPVTTRDGYTVWLEKVNVVETHWWGEYGKRWYVDRIYNLYTEELN